MPKTISLEALYYQQAQVTELQLNDSWEILAKSTIHLIYAYQRQFCNKELKAFYTCDSYKKWEKKLSNLPDKKRWHYSRACWQKSLSFTLE